MLLLKVLIKGSVLRDVRVEGREARIGRDQGCEIVLPDPRVSRNQALIRKAGDEYFLEPSEGRGGLRHNGTEVEHGSPPVPIHPGDRIGVGDYVIEVQSWSPGEDDAASYVSEQQAARELQLSERDLDSLLDEGLLRSRHLRGRRVFDSGTLDAARATLQARNTRLMKPQARIFDNLETIDRISEGIGIPLESINEIVADGRIRAFRDRGEILLNRDEVVRALEAGFAQGGDSLPVDMPAAEIPDPPAAPDEDSVPVRDFARMAGMTVTAVEAVLRERGIETLPGPGGSRVRKGDLASLLSLPPGRPVLIEDARPHFSPVADVEEDPTDDTQDGLPSDPVSQIKGSASVKYFQVMNPGRTYPLVVKASRLTARVRVVPRVPGCLCVPQGLDLSPDAPNAEFWLTPQACGAVPGAAVEFHFDGRKTSEARIPCKVRGILGAWAMFLSAGVLLAAALILDAAGAVIAPGSVAAGAVAIAGGPAPLALLLSGAAFAAGVAWFTLGSPRESQGVAVSVSGQPEHKSSPNA